MTISTYVDSNGDANWPQAEVDDDCEYGVDWGTWLTNEGDTKSTLTWEVPAGVTQTATREDGSIAIIQFVARTAGRHKFRSALTSIDGSVTQVKHKTVYITVK